MICKRVFIFVILKFIAFNLFSIDSIENMFLPFNSVNDRNCFYEIENKLLDGFAAYRIAGHKHSGIDIKGQFNENVYAIGKGVVVAIYGQFPYSTVLIQHILSNNEIIYSGYTHIEDIEVIINQAVDQNTKIGRLFSKQEYESSGFYQNHLHFEIRKTLERYKGISIKCFSVEELNKYFYDPEIFLKKYLNKK